MTATPVVIGSRPGSPWLADCLTSIPPDRDVKIHHTGGYEIAALRTACRHYDRFLFLQDSTQVLDPAFWDLIDTTPPTWLFGWPPMYMAVFHREDLAPVLAEAPDVMTKESSIVWERDLTDHLGYPYLWPEVVDTTGRIERRHERTNLVLETPYLRKWKGTWR